MTRRLLEVSGHLQILIGDQPTEVRAEKSIIIVELPSILVFGRMVRDLRGLKPSRKQLAQTSQWLAHLGLTITVQTPKRHLVTIGAKGNSLLLRLFGIRNATVAKP